MKTIKKSWFPLLFILPLLALISSCEKDMNNKVTLSNSSNSIAQIEGFLANNAPIKQTFQLNAASYNTVRGAEGTSITIPYNAFVDANGNPVSGNFTFELQEIFSPADMIFTGKMTSSGGRTLVSGGEMYINATQGGADLQLAPGKSLDISVPSCNYDSEMDLFVGNGQDGDDFDWVPETNSVVYQCQDSINPCQTNYCFNITDLFNWINCDYFFNDPRPLTEVEIQVPAGYDQQNTQVYAYIPSINSITRTSFQNGSFWITGGYKMPVGLGVTFVGLNHDGTDLYYSIQNATIVNNHVEVLSFQKVTAAQLAILLQNL
ncbi:hypothetical protein Oweho_3360 [Owenweeksia hongkongensis DSM 17368]|uniref:Uncharacterized protein n=1 Tax=Owenweeksia hongkongensis (strain DSM 17368 / CIP 108786 / JCM 12287 / NRRL B-23963 / UST20020801) TaxID=926562 RepID=G8R4Z7_OWEHD|nr:hypothetical protein [Owenweeksia hongkongensis]AEV34311.1 hypothetical protein Oweho_3360 [Owenweeksia hongkongensis DSM 17368]